MKKINLYTLSIAIITLGYILIRYVLFDMHGMRDFPLMLYTMGLIIVIVTVLKKKQYVALCTSFGYIMSFGFGMIFGHDYADALGNMTLNNSWIIWIFTYIIFIMMGFVIEYIMKRQTKRLY